MQFYRGWREVSSAYNNGLEKGVTIQYMFILQILAKHKSLRVSQVSELTHLDSSAVSTIISRMEKKHLVQREHDLVTDRRQVFISITSKGLKLLKNNQPIYDQYTKSLFEDIDEKDKETLKKIVQRMNNNRLRDNQARK